MQEKIPVRLRGVHVINQPAYYTALYAIFKPFLKAKLRKRVSILFVTGQLELPNEAISGFFESFE